MKKMFRKRIYRIVAIGMLCSLFINYLLQIRMSQNDMESQSEALFWQVGQIISENEIETEKVTDEFQSECLAKARTAAYLIQNQPEIEKNQKEIEHVAELLQVDELHLFNTKGIIYAGSETKYIGYHFDSGEQIHFFKPMLEDKNLELCQPITPNTAEGKLMQYSAVWREDGQGIIQIGMEPERVLEVTKKNELSYIFSLLTEDKGADLYAVDVDTKEVLGSTNQKNIGKTLDDMGIEMSRVESGGGSFHTYVNDTASYCVAKKMNDILLVRVCSLHVLYSDVNRSTLFLSLYLLALGVTMALAISKYLDRKIIQEIDVVNHKLQNITEGDLDEKIEVHTTPEFSELSGHINQMVGSILATTDKLSSVLDMAEVPIGAYEYSFGMNRVQVTSKIPEIMGWSEEEKSRLLGDYKLFQKELSDIMKSPLEFGNNIFVLPGEPERYVKIESYKKDNSEFGVLMDVTQEIAEKRKIEQERDEDLLTGLRSRRAFMNQMRRLFTHPEDLRQTAMIMIDTDNLKQINDGYGHEMGDYYLRGMADVIRLAMDENQIAARLSGDEFAILVYGCETREELETQIRKLEKYQNGYEIQIPDGRTLTVTFSMGSAYYPEDGENYGALLKCADSRMYETKYQKKKNDLFRK